MCIIYVVLRCACVVCGCVSSVVYVCVCVAGYEYVCSVSVCCVLCHITLTGKQLSNILARCVTEFMSYNHYPFCASYYTPDAI